MKIFAERAGRALGPENTISTIEKSIHAGADGAHVDIRCSMDDLPVLMHDATVDRTTNGGGEVFRMNLDVLMHLDAGGGIHVPSLVKTLDMLQDEKCVLLLELKHPATALPTAEIVHHYQSEKNYTQGRLIITSQYHQLIALIHDKYPKILTGAALKKIPESLAACGEYTGARFVLPPVDCLSDAFMKDASKRDLMVIASGCETKEQLDTAKVFGAYGAITPDPSLAPSS